MTSLANPLRKLPVAGMALLLAGCAVGPDFERPAAPQVSGYVAQPLKPTAASAGVAGGQAQTFAGGTGGTDVAADWWTLFHSKPLNDLIARSEEHTS